MSLSSQQQDYRWRLVQASTSKPGTRFSYARMMGKVTVSHQALAEGSIDMSHEDFDALVDHGVLRLINDFECIVKRGDD